MHVRTLFGAMVLLSVAAPTMAALPPYYQRLREIEAVANAVDTALKNAPIDEISYVSEDLYRVRAGTCRVMVRLRDVPGDHPPGPRKFTVHPGKAVCGKVK